MSQVVSTILKVEDRATSQLDKIKNTFKLTDAEAKKVMARMKTMTKEMKKGFAEAGKACRTMAVGLTAVASAGAMVVGKTVEAADRIDKMSQKLQMSRQTFQEMDYVFSQNGASVESMGKGMMTLSKHIAGVTQGNKSSVKTFSQLGISVKDSSGKLKSTENVMFEVLEKLQKMPDNAQRAALATSLLGKSAMELQPLLNSGAKSVSELRQKFNELGMGISDNAVDSAVKFKDTMDTVQRSLQGAMYQIGADVLPAIQEVADYVVNNMPQIKAAVMPVISAMTNVIKFCADHVRALTVVLGIAVTAFGALKVIEVARGLMAGFQAVLTAVKIAQIGLNIAMNANPVGLIITGVGLLIGGLVALEAKFGIISKAINFLWETGKKCLSWLKDNLYVLAGPLGLVFKGATVLFDKISGGDNGKGKKQKYAAGTSSSLGGVALVGENGPELVNLPTGSKVTNNSETKNIMNKDIVINLNIGGNLIGNSEFINQIKFVLGQELKTALAV